MVSCRQKGRVGVKADDRTLKGSCLKDMHWGSAS